MNEQDQEAALRRAYSEGKKGRFAPSSASPDIIRQYQAGRNAAQMWDFADPPKKTATPYVRPPSAPAGISLGVGGGSGGYSKVGEWSDNLLYTFPLSAFRKLGEWLTESGWTLRLVFAGIGAALAVPLQAASTSPAVLYAIAGFLGLIFPFVAGHIILIATKAVALSLSVGFRLLQIVACIALVLLGMGVILYLLSLAQKT